MIKTLAVQKAHSRKIFSRIFVIVYVAPLYIYNMSSLLKAFQDRCIPLVGEILVPAGELLKQDALKEMMKIIIDMVSRAGVEVVRDGRVSRETEEAIRQPIIPTSDIINLPMRGGKV